MDENNEVNQESVIEDTIQPTPPKKRGRPLGWKAKTSETTEETIGDEKPAGKRGPKKRVAFDTDALAKNLQGVHIMLAVMTGEKCLEISEIESKMLATSVVSVADEYGFSLSGKTGATIQLLGCMGIIYLPRIMAMREAQRVANASVVVHDQP